MALKISPMFDTITIVGPGLIGGSFGMAVKHHKLVRRVIGVGRREVSLQNALDAGAIDEATLVPEDGVKEADLVILATSVGTIPLLARRVIPHMKDGSILSDVGSVKARIVSEIERALSRHQSVRFVGCHPLAGSEKRGVDAARRNLFEDRCCIITPTARTDADAMERVGGIWARLGARIVLLDPKLHDDIVSRVSHLPHIAAAALVNAISDSDCKFVATGFRDVTRVASGDASLWTDICKMNRQAILAALKSFSEQVNEFAAHLEAGEYEKVREYLDRAKARRDNLAGGGEA